MTNDMVKPPYNAKRRIQLLFAFCIFSIVAATAGWYFVAGKIDGEAAKAIETQRILGIQIDCPNREVRGYPFRFGVFCDSIGVTDIKGGGTPSFSTGELRSAAQFYDPAKIVAELDGPATLKLGAEKNIELNWSIMRATGVIAQPLPENISVVGKDFKLTASEGSLSADQIEAHMRVVGADVDLAARAVALSFSSGFPQLNGLPPLGADFNIRFNNAAAQIAQKNINIRGSEGQLNRTALLLNDDSGLIIDGPFSIDNAGLIDSTLSVRIIDVDAVTTAFGKSFPQIAPMLSAFAAGQPRTGEKGDEVVLNITIAKSQVSMGFIPLGKLKPL